MERMGIHSGSPKASFESARKGWRQSKGNRGVTLMEILIAIIIMSIGLAGIVVLFHPSMRASKETLEETRAVVIAQSIRDSLTGALRFAQYDEASDTYTVTLTHDMEGGKLLFKLPPLKVNNLPRNNQNEWVHYPGATTPSKEGNYFTPEKDKALLLNKDWISNVVKEISKKDPSEPYEQFLFSFDVRREDVPKLYGFRVNVFRATGNLDQSDPEKEHVKTFTFQISTP